MAGIRLADVHVEHELFTSRDYNLKRQMVDAARRRRSPRAVIHALSGITLEVSEGARLGLVGPNGAGKSTLLSVVAGLLPPTRGTVEVDGRVLALLGAASAGLDAEASGRDNIIMAGLQLGESPAAMRARVEEITEFSGLSKRIDHAVHTYSSGMQARLRFSILTSLRPDVLVIDEGIGMADAEFSERAGARLAEFLTAAGILVMASHSEALISQHCTTAVWLDQGVIRGAGTVDQVLGGYRALHHQEPEFDPAPPPPNRVVITADDALEAEELPPSSWVQISELSYHRGRLLVAGTVVLPDSVEHVLVGAPPWTPLTELSMVHTTGVDAHFGGEVVMAPEDVPRAELYVRTRGQGVYRIGDLAARALATDPVFALFERFKGLVRSVATPRLLEVGSRLPSEVVYNDWIPPDGRYIGLDILDGPNVDVVGDAHSMSQALPARYFDAAFSLATFEHLEMPWVVAVELNRVLRSGGYVFVLAHQTWPIHEVGGDFFRFSEHAWETLFNERSGFEICDVASGEPAKVVPTVAHAATMGLEAYPAYLSTAVLARKMGETDLRWDAH